MEEVLQRLLEVEKAAEERVREAELEAERITADGRREADALRERLQEDIAREAETVIQERVNQAEQRKGEALSEVRGRIEREARELERGFDSAVEHIVHRLTGL